MKKYRGLLFLITLILSGAFGTAHLFQLRFEQGDIYPPYSTLRYDPQGASIAYDTCATLEELSVSRNYLELPENVTWKKCSFITLGVDPDILALDENIDILSTIAREGGRVCVGLSQNALSPEEKSSGNTECLTLTCSDNTAPNDSITCSANSTFSSTISCSANSILSSNVSCSSNITLSDNIEEPPSLLIQKWGLTLLSTKEGTEEEEEEENKKKSSTSSPQVLFQGEIYPLSTTNIFTKLDEEWETLALYKEYPIIIERAYGAGHILLIADSSLLSNEILYRGRRTRALSWVLGDSTQVIFDESQHGIISRIGIIDLVRRYHLEGFLFSSLFILLLYIWSQASPRRPIHREEDKEDSIIITAPHDVDALSSLVSQSFSPNQALKECFTLWQETQKRNPHLKLTEEKQKEIETIISAYSQQPRPQQSISDTWRSIHSIIHRTSL